MIVWSQDEKRIVLFEQVKSFHIRFSLQADDNPEYKETSFYEIYADDIYMGKVETEVEANRILAKISANYKTYQNECNPW